MISFTLNCTPTAQARVRHAVRNGHAVAYKSDAQKANEATLEASLTPHTPLNALEGALELFFIAFLPTPHAASKNAIEGMLRGKIWHTKKPDLDNIAKQLKDAMTRKHFWHDDRQVVRLSCEKRYAKAGRWEVCVRKAGEES